MINDGFDGTGGDPWSRVSAGGAFQTNELTQLVASSDDASKVLEIVVADDSTDYIQLQTSAPTGKITPITFSGISSTSKRLVHAKIEVRRKGDQMVIATLNVLVVPNLPDVQLKFYFTVDGRYLDDTHSLNGTLLGTKIRDDRGGLGYGGAVSMADDVAQRFNQFGVNVVDQGSTEDRDVQFLGPPDQIMTAGPVWNHDYLSWTQGDLITQIFTPDLFGGGNFNIVLLHRTGVNGTGGGFFCPETGLCFMGYDHWFPGTSTMSYPWWSGKSWMTRLQPDALGRDSTRWRVCSHEIGHAMLPVRNAPDYTIEPLAPAVNGWDGGHDFGPAPAGTDSLMRASGPKGKWLRHEDWETAVNEIKRRLGI